jgi:hypothetical protein
MSVLSQRQNARSIVADWIVAHSPHRRATSGDKHGSCSIAAVRKFGERAAGLDFGTSTIWSERVGFTDYGRAALREQSEGPVRHS